MSQVLNKIKSNIHLIFYTFKTKTFKLYSVGFFLINSDFLNFGEGNHKITINYNVKNKTASIDTIHLD